MRNQPDIKYGEVVWTQDQIEQQNMKAIWGYILKYFDQMGVDIDFEYEIAREVFFLESRFDIQIQTMKIGFYIIEKKRRLQPVGEVIIHPTPKDEEE